MLDKIALIGAGVTTILSGVLGLLLWRAQKKLGSVRRQLDFAVGVELPLCREAAKALRRNLARKEKVIRELQTKLAESDPGGAFDSLFGDDSSD